MAGKKRRNEGEEREEIRGRREERKGGVVWAAATSTKTPATFSAPSTRL